MRVEIQKRCFEYTRKEEEKSRQQCAGRPMGDGGLLRGRLGTGICPRWDAIDGPGLE